MFTSASPSRYRDVKELRNCHGILEHDLEVIVDQQVVIAPRHRASYTLERGVWSATCRICGFTAKDKNRSRAATWFLAHIRSVRLELRAGSEPSPLADRDTN
jgi:hypothetical protein